MNIIANCKKTVSEILDNSQNQSHNSQTAINNSQHDELNSQLIEIKC